MCGEVGLGPDAQQGAGHVDGTDGSPGVQVEGHGVAGADEFDVQAVVGGGEPAIDEGDEAGAVSGGPVDQGLVDRRDDGLGAGQEGATARAV